MSNQLKEVCKNCGLTKGAHSAIEYWSDYYQKEIPYNYCPGNEGRMNWDKSPGSTFKSSGLFFEVKYGTRWSYPIGGSDERKKSENLASPINTQEG